MDVPITSGKSPTTTKGWATLPSSSYSSLMPYQMPQVRENILKIFPDAPSTIVDATVHIGRDAIHFSSIFPNAKIIALDNDPDAIECLKKNIDNHADVPSNFNIIEADTTEWIEGPAAIKADFYYFDPPWGGPGYNAKKEMELFLGGKKISHVINRVFDRELTQKCILKVPRNFAYPSFKQELDGRTTELHYIRKPQKEGYVAFGLVVIS